MRKNKAIFNKKNEISIDDIKELFLNSCRGVLAVNKDNGYPYAFLLIVFIVYIYDIRFVLCPIKYYSNE